MLILKIQDLLTIINSSPSFQKTVFSVLSFLCYFVFFICRLETETQTTCAGYEQDGFYMEDGTGSVNGEDEEKIILLLI
jgi:hypothetical protein